MKWERATKDDLSSLNLVLINWIVNLKIKLSLCLITCLISIVRIVKPEQELQLLLSLLKFKIFMSKENLWATLADASILFATVWFWWQIWLWLVPQLEKYLASFLSDVGIVVSLAWNFDTIETLRQVKRKKLESIN